MRSFSPGKTITLEPLVSLVFRGEAEGPTSSITPDTSKPGSHTDGKYSYTTRCPSLVTWVTRGGGGWINQTWVTAEWVDVPCMDG